MMPMLRMSARAVVRGMADFRDCFGLHQLFKSAPTGPGPIRAIAASARVHAASVDSFVLQFSDSRPRNPAHAILMAALGPSPGSRGVGGQLRMIATGNSFHEPPTHLEAGFGAPRALAFVAPALAFGTLW